MCYFHVNAIFSVTVATSMIDRAGQVGGGRKERENKCLGFFYKPNAQNPLNPSMQQMHTLAHKDKKFSNLLQKKPNKKPIKHPNRELQDVEPCTQDPSDSQPLISSFLSPPPS